MLTLILSCAVGLGVIGGPCGFVNFAAAMQDMPPAPSAESADTLLDRLEKSGEELTAFTATFRYDKFSAADERKEIRLGNLIYQNDPTKKQKRFMVEFDQLRSPTIKDIDVRYVFDGSWLAEIDADAKQFIRRQIVAPGEVFDPLKLGEGPIPLPIAQKKADVVSRFSVTSIPVPASGLLSSLKDVSGLRLVPKAGTNEAREIAHIDLFFDRATLLPAGVETIGARLADPEDPASRDRKTILLREIARNPALTPDQLAKLDVQIPDPKEWRVHVEPWPQ